MLSKIIQLRVFFGKPCRRFAQVPWFSYFQMEVLFSIFFSIPWGGLINVLVLEISPSDFLLHNEAENTNCTLKIEYKVLT